jgi:hypothetical protein
VKKASLFEPWVIENGRQRRATAAELKECTRLWFKHADIRLGKRRTATTSSYEAVVWSSHWKRLTKAQKALAAGCCERCGRLRDHLEVPHLTYARAGQELPEDVVVVCRGCHRTLDKLRRRGESPHVSVTVGEAKRVVVWGQS